MQLITLTPEQATALRAFAAKYGRAWKQKLRDAWTNATLYQHIEPHHVAALQQVRNTLGPSGLAKVRL